MKKYDVTGIGNALVDFEFRATDQFFEENGIEKGLMTLVDEARQKELMQVIDTDHAKKQCGGSAGNTVIAINQFGGKSFYCCKVANDETGHFYMNDMKENGVDHNLNSTALEEGVTGKCLVMVTEDAERTMNTFLGITETYSESNVDEEAIKASKYVYIEGYLITSENGKAAMKYAKKIAEDNGVKVAITFSDPAMVKYFKDPFSEVLGDGVDILFSNEEEAMLYTGKDTLIEAGEELKKIAKQFVITKGEKGAVIWDGDSFIDIDPFPAEAIDTNGAGDMFAGAIMFGVTNGYSFDSSGKLAAMASAKVVSEYGPRLRREEAENLLSKLDLN